MIAAALAHHAEPVRVQAARFAGSPGDHLGAAEQTLGKLSPSLLRAVSQERFAMNSNRRLVARETDIALREAEKLVDQLRRAKAALASCGEGL